VALRDPAAIDVPADLAGLDALLDQAPEGPAVFLIRLRDAEPYLARTTVLRRRLKRLLGARPGFSRWLNLRSRAARIEYWLAGSRFETALLFYELARHHFPETYLELIKLRMPAYVKLIWSNPFPRTQVTTRLTGGRSFYYGPFRSRGAAEQFEAGVLDQFQVRRCQEDLDPSPSHPGCVYGEMNKCLRPCQCAVSPEEYHAETERLAAFLRSGGRSLTEVLQTARERFSEDLQFEDASREHRRIEKIDEVLRLRDDLACDAAALHGVAVTASSEPGAVELRFMISGCWQPQVRFGFEVVEGLTVSIDHRLREIVATLAPGKPSTAEREEHLALLARWYYSSWRDGEWLSFPDLDHVPYRKLVNAISRVASAR
jgi:excinuclease ABC subunit C